jgi:FecR protein
MRSVFTPRQTTIVTENDRRSFRIQPREADIARSFAVDSWVLIVTLHRLWLAIWFCGGLILGGTTSASAMLSPVDVDSAPLPVDAAAGLTRLAQTQPAPQAPAAPDASAAAPAAADEPIGNVVALTGVATVIRNKDSIALKLRDDIFLNDTVQTSNSSSLGITFNDATTFNLRANAKITIDSYVYEDGGKDNAGIFDIGKGTVAFVAAAVAKTGDMKITTPTTSLGIRGTTGLVEVGEGGAAATPSNIKLYPDPDGHVGRIEVNDRTGARLGALSQGASGFTIRPAAAGGRVSAEPLRISPQQVQRDQGFVREVHAAQTTGRQIVTEQPALRRANPNLNNQNRNTPRTPQRQNGLPGQNRPGQPQPNRPGQPQQPANPNRQGQKEGPNKPQPAGRPEPTGQRPNQPPQPGQPQHTGQPPRPGQPQPAGQPQRERGQPGTPPQGLPPRQPALRQGAPDLRRPNAPPPQLRRPGPPNRPALVRPRPGPTPKGKRPKQEPR